MRPAVCVIALGSNLGDKKANLRFAIRSISRLKGTRVLKSSSAYENPARGVVNQPDFLNAAVKIMTRLSPAGLLVELKRIEALRGRKPGPRWAARALDCDILFFAGKKIRTRLLAIPHPLAAARPFVLVPLAEILPEWETRALPHRENVKCKGAY